ncbi:TetR family transcriptional regulator, partial [Rhodococcus sp. (in: high G+C Gram-positive bacteria)]|uniref:acyl-CoA-like ligand-binding transcription factor n=2 Tax=Nocardiaceae TaxID=85025 RepID=UPI00257A0730
VRQGGAGIVTLLEDRPPAESADLAISRAILERSNAFESAEIDQWRSAFRTAPHLMDRVALIAPEHRDRLVELVAQRMQLDPENDSRPGLLVHLMLAAAEFGYRQWIRNPHKRGASLPVCVEGALDAVRGSRWHTQDEDDTKGRDQ